MLSGELGVSQAFLARWYIGGDYMDISEVVVFYDCDSKLPLLELILKKKHLI